MIKRGIVFNNEGKDIVINIGNLYSTDHRLPWTLELSRLVAQLSSVTVLMVSFE